MNLKALTGDKLFRPVMGAVLAVLCGWALWTMPLGERWVNASYDSLFRFGSRVVTNPVVLVLFDKSARDEAELESGQRSDRAFQAQLLNKLADDACPLVVLDVFFRTNREPSSDHALEAALRRQRRIVLAAWQDRREHTGLDTVPIRHRLFDSLQ